MHVAVLVIIGIVVLAAFFFGAALVFAPAAVFGPRGALFSWLAPCFAGAGDGATGAPGAATLAAVSWFAYGSCCSSILFCARFAHDDSCLWCASNATEI